MADRPHPVPALAEGAALASNRMSSDASLVRRTLPMMLADDPEVIHCMALTRGRCCVAQEDRSDIAEPDELISRQSSVPFEIESLTSFDGIIVEVPSKLMGAHVDRVCRRTAQRVDGGTGMGKLVRHHLEIALRWGFVSAPHFSRAFRAAYGVSPRDFRAAFRAG